MIDLMTDSVDISFVSLCF